MGAEILAFLMVLGGGNQAADLVSLLPVDAYFQARRVPVNVDNMLYLAGKDPADGAAQIKQLLALRVLAERPDDVKKAKNAGEILATLDKIAKGKLAKDGQGFAQEYAARALARLKGGKAVPAKSEKLTQALRWIPDGVTFVAAVDTHSSADGPDTTAAMAQFWKMFPERNLERLFDTVELLGNVRVDRWAIGFKDGADRGQGEIFMHFSGKGDPKRIAEAMKTLARANMQIEASKDSGGKSLLMLQDGDRPPAMALIGDTEFLMCGFERNKGNHRGLLERVLAVRDGKQDSVFKGAFKDALGKMSDKANALALGQLPAEMRRELARGPFPALPASVKGEAFRAKEGIDFRLQGTMASADDAKVFTQAVGILKQKGLDALQNIPGNFLPPETIAALRKSLESIQVISKDATVEVRFLVPQHSLLSLPAMMFGLRGEFR
jgi:hypothetical protein